MGQFYDGWVASESQDHDAIKVKRLYVDINDGNWYDAALFSQIMYWHGRNKETGKRRLQIERDGHFWLAKRYEDWWTECRITAETAKKAITRMVQRGLLVKNVWLFDGKPTVHIRVNIDGFEVLANHCIAENKELASDFELNRSNVPNGKGTIDRMEKVQRTDSITETTTQTPTETTEKKEIPAPVVAVANETPKSDTIEEIAQKPNEGTGKVINFESASQTIEDTPPRPKLHEVTEAALGMKSAAYGLVEKYVNFFTGQTPEYAKGKGKPRHNGDWYTYQINPAMSIDEIGGFGAWYRANHQGDFPSACMTLNKYVAKFRAAKDHDRYVDRFHRDRVTVIVVDESALPTAAGGGGQSYIGVDKRAEAERLLSEIGAKLNGNGGYGTRREEQAQAG